MKSRTKPPWSECRGAGLSTSSARKQYLISQAIPPQCRKQCLHGKIMQIKSLQVVTKVSLIKHSGANLYLFLDGQQEELAWTGPFRQLGQPVTAIQVTLCRHSPGCCELPGSREMRFDCLLELHLK